MKIPSDDSPNDFLPLEAILQFVPSKVTPFAERALYEAENDAVRSSLKSAIDALPIEPVLETCYVEEIDDVQEPPADVSLWITEVYNRPRSRVYRESENVVAVRPIANHAYSCVRRCDNGLTVQFSAETWPFEFSWAGQDYRIYKEAK